MTPVPERLCAYVPIAPMSHILCTSVLLLLVSSGLARQQPARLKQHQAAHSLGTVNSLRRALAQVCPACWTQGGAKSDWQWLTLALLLAGKLQRCAWAIFPA